MNIGCGYGREWRSLWFGYTSISGDLAVHSGAGSVLWDCSLEQGDALVRLTQTIIMNGARTPSFRYLSPSILIIFNKLEQTNPQTCHTIPSYIDHRHSHQCEHLYEQLSDKIHKYIHN